MWSGQSPKPFRLDWLAALSWTAESRWGFFLGSVVAECSVQWRHAMMGAYMQHMGLPGGGCHA